LDLSFDRLLMMMKGKVVHMHVMKAYRGRRGTAPLILSLGISWKYIVSFALATSLLGKEPLVPNE